MELEWMVFCLLPVHFIYCQLIEPEWMVLCLLPVPPPELRVITQIERAKLMNSDILLFSHMNILGKVYLRCLQIELFMAKHELTVRDTIFVSNTCTKRTCYIHGKIHVRHPMYSVQ